MISRSGLVLVPTCMDILFPNPNLQRVVWLCFAMPTSSFPLELKLGKTEFQDLAIHNTKRHIPKLVFSSHLTNQHSEMWT